MDGKRRRLSPYNLLSPVSNLLEPLSLSPHTELFSDELFKELHPPP